MESEEKKKQRGGEEGEKGQGRSVKSVSPCVVAKGLPDPQANYESRLQSNSARPTRLEECHSGASSSTSASPIALSPTDF